MDRQRISAIAHGQHPIAAPLSELSVRRLLDRALPQGHETVLDLGCGAGAWLVQALGGRPGIRATGVDIEADSIARARRTLTEKGLDDRVDLRTLDAKEFTAPERYDVVLTVGAAHAFGGLLPTLAAAGRFVAPGGTLLVGDGFWEREPDEATIALGFEADEFDDLATTVDRITATGWLPVYARVSTLEEWDDYEWSWTGTLSAWALDNPDNPDRAAALDAANEHRAGWLRGYRRTLGFVTFLLRRPDDGHEDWSTAAARPDALA